MNTYDGGKNAVFHHIINQQPPHDNYIELFLGSGAVMRRKRPAPHLNIGVEIDGATVAAVQPLLSPVAVVVKEDCITWLRRQRYLLVPADEASLIYADPPYLMTTRSCQRPLYGYEFADESQHIELLTELHLFPGLVMVSGYRSALYDRLLSNWRRVEFSTVKRNGKRATECLWCNFPDPVELHDYRFLGTDRTERQRIKRKKERWKSKLLKMSTLERGAVFTAIAELRSTAGVYGCTSGQTKTAARPAAQSASASGPAGRLPQPVPAADEHLQSIPTTKALL